MPQFWTLWVKKAVPECLQIDDWYIEEFVYHIIKDERKSIKHPTITEFCGTMEDAYRFYGILPADLS